MQEKKGYAVGIVESECGKITDTWKHQPKLLFENDGGPEMIFRTFDGQLVIVLYSPTKARKIECNSIN